MTRRDFPRSFISIRSFIFLFFLPSLSLFSFNLLDWDGPPYHKSSSTSWRRSSSARMADDPVMVEDEDQKTRCTMGTMTTRGGRRRMTTRRSNVIKRNHRRPIYPLKRVYSINQPPPFPPSHVKLPLGSHDQPRGRFFFFLNFLFYPASTRGHHTAPSPIPAPHCSTSTHCNCHGLWNLQPRRIQIFSGVSLELELLEFVGVVDRDWTKEIREINF